MEGGETVAYLAFLATPGPGAESMYMITTLFWPNPSPGSPIQKPRLSSGQKTLLQLTPFSHRTQSLPFPLSSSPLLVILEHRRLADSLTSLKPHLHLTFPRWGEN